MSHNHLNQFVFWWGKSAWSRAHCIGCPRDTGWVVGMFSVEQPLAGRDGRELASFPWGLCGLLFSWWGPAFLWVIPSLSVGHWQAGFPRTLGCFEPN